MIELRAGDPLYLTRAASVQFSKPILFRLIRVLDWETYHGWVWLDGYELDKKGEAVARRSVFVQQAGIRVRRTAQMGQRQARSQTVDRGRAGAAQVSDRAAVLPAQVR